MIDDRSKVVEQSPKTLAGHLPAILNVVVLRRHHRCVKPRLARAKLLSTKDGLLYRETDPNASDSRCSVMAGRAVTCLASTGTNHGSGQARFRLFRCTKHTKHKHDRLLHKPQIKSSNRLPEKRDRAQQLVPALFTMLHFRRTPCNPLTGKSVHADKSHRFRLKSTTLALRFGNKAKTQGTNERGTLGAQQRVCLASCSFLCEMAPDRKSKHTIVHLGIPQHVFCLSLHGAVARAKHSRNSPTIASTTDCSGQSRWDASWLACM